jgi:putative membrane protein
MRTWIKLAALAAFVALAGTGRADDTTKAEGKGLTDAQFVMKAASGGMAEVAMGKLGQEMGRSEDVKKFGARMVTDHTKANQELMQIVADLKLTAPEKPLPEHEKHLKDLAGGKAADFDKEYMHHMVMSHEEAVKLFTRASKELKNEKLRAFAEKTLPVIKEHLAMAKEIHEKVGKGSE